MENIITNIYSEINKNGKYISSYTRKGNPHYSYKDAPDWMIILIKLILNWSKKIGDAINHVKTYEYNLNIKDLITDDVDDCDIIPFNVLI